MAQGLYFFKLLRTFAVLCLMVVVAACSFKNEKTVKEIEPQVVVDQKEPSKTLEKVFDQDNESQIIVELVENEKLFLSDSKALDLAIQKNKLQVIKFLLVRGINPFLVDQESIRKIEYDADIGNLILSGQQNVIIDLLRSYPRSSAESFLIFRDKIDKLKIGSKGCQMLVESLLNERYLGEKSMESGEYYQVTAGLQLDDVVKRVFTETSCRDEIKTFQYEAVRKWMSWEFMYQFQRNFETSSFIQFLAGVSKVDSLNIVVPNVAVYEESTGSKFRMEASQIKLDPMALFFLKVPCMSNDQDINVWIDIIRNMRSDVNSGYNYFFDLPQGIQEIAQCRVKKDYEHPCNSNEKSYSNASVVYMISGFFFRSNLTRNVFEKSWYDLIVDPQKSNKQDFKKVLCTKDVP